jgi:hypothetical protein
MMTIRQTATSLAAFLMLARHRHGAVSPSLGPVTGTVRIEQIAVMWR